MPPLGPDPLVCRDGNFRLKIAERKSIRRKEEYSIKME